MGGEELPTKRIVLLTLMTLFDALGLVGFLSSKGKLVLEQMCDIRWIYSPISE